MAGRLRARALGIMKQLEAGASAYRLEIEKELAARVGKSPDLPVPARVSAKPPKPGESGKAVRCTCGTDNDPDARFCKSCGTSLTESRA